MPNDAPKNDDPSRAHNPRLSPPPRPVGVEYEPAPSQQAAPSASSVQPHPLHTAQPPVGEEIVSAQEKRRRKKVSAWVVGYVALVLLVDLLASTETQLGIHWSVFRWRPGLLFGTAESLVNTLGLPYALCAWMLNPLVQGLDFFKITFWLLVPLVFSWKSMDWGWWRTTRWRNVDWWALTAIVVLGIGVMFAVKYVPTLQAFYPSRAGLSFAQKADFVVIQLFWVASWLIGYEFLHRYVLLQRVNLHWPQFGWLLVPLFDAAYHLPKPGLEIAGMFFFGLALTWWARRRRNLLLPIAAHLIIEIELVLFLVLV